MHMYATFHQNIPCLSKSYENFIQLLTDGRTNRHIHIVSIVQTHGSCNNDKKIGIPLGEISLGIGFSLTGWPPMHYVYSNLKIVFQYQNNFLLR